MGPQEMLDLAGGWSVSGALVQSGTGSRFGNTAWDSDIFCCDVHGRKGTGIVLHHRPYSGYRWWRADCLINNYFAAIKI